MFKFLLILSLIASIFPKKLLAAESNQFGIHILEPNDLVKASQLVNSNGGDWGWVTIVIRDDDMNHDKWQAFMDECRTSHLRPIIRIATHLQDGVWAQPTIDDAKNWANFLNDLNWPVKDQWVIIFNEPNHAAEFGGEVNPKQYARILLEFSAKLKEKNPNFKILNAGLDLAASKTKTTDDAFFFLKKMGEEIPGVFNLLDGWASHSYPNHGYLGKPWETGPHSVKGYESELKYLKNQAGLKNDLPVFITETGWPKKNSKTKDKYYSDEIAAEYLRYTFENLWLKDQKIMAVTPFVLNYPDPLFYAFSWLDEKGIPFKNFETISQLPKIQARPEQEFKSEVINITKPPFLLTNHIFTGQITLKNTGQSIWGEYTSILGIPSKNKEVEVSSLLLPQNILVKPGEKISLEFDIKTSSSSGDFILGWEDIGEIEIKVATPNIVTSTQYTLWQKVFLKIEKIIKNIKK